MANEQQETMKSVGVGYVIFVTGTVCQELADMVTQKIIEIDMDNKIKGKNIPVNLMINSPGGDLNSAWQICDVMDFVETPIYTTGLGQIASAALIIFMNGDAGHRTLTDRSSILSHRFSWGAVGSHKDLLAVQPEINNMHKRMITHYMETTGHTQKYIETNLLNSNDVWLTSEQAVQYNLADEIYKSKKQKLINRTKRIKGKK